MAFIKGFQSVSSTPLTILFAYFRGPQRLFGADRPTAFFALGRY
jgi:hypothetical protein